MTSPTENLPGSPMRVRPQLIAVMVCVFAACFAAPLLMSHPRAQAVDGLLSVRNLTGVQAGRAGEVLKYAFEITNTSAEPVRVLGAESSCGCTTVLDALPLTLRPAERLILTVQLALSKAPPADGQADSQISRSVRLLVNRSGNVPLMTVQATTLPNP